MNTDVARGLEDAVDKMEADDEVWVGILAGARTGKGHIFCAGADLKQMSVDPGGMMTERGGFAGFVKRARTKPIIAAIDGPALADGTEIYGSAYLKIPRAFRRKIRTAAPATATIHRAIAP